MRGHQQLVVSAGREQHVCTQDGPSLPRLRVGCRWPCGAWHSIILEESGKEVCWGESRDASGYETDRLRRKRDPAHR